MTVFELRKENLTDLLQKIKDKISEANDYAIKHNLRISGKYAILDLSCICDEIIAEINELEI